MNAQDIYYQVKSFRCRNKFLNIKKTDIFTLRMFVQYSATNGIDLVDVESDAYTFNIVNNAI